jgi:glycine C-acetyltransferase
MPSQNLEPILASELEAMADAGSLKGAECVITGVIPPGGGKGPRYRLAGEGDKPYLRMNSNGYLGMALNRDVMAAEEAATRAFGAGPGAVRFISGTSAPHVALEQRLARFHNREAAMVMSSAYATVMGVLPALITPETAVISDELNHNCIINAMRLARPGEKQIYPHLDMDGLERALEASAKTMRRAIIVTDGIFSMRGDHAPLAYIMGLAQSFDQHFPENVLVVVDDSHGVGATGATGRGTEEITGSAHADLLIATLGKAFGVNGGYVAASRALIAYLREKSPFYIYSNPITPGEAAAAAKALDILDSAEGQARLEHLREMTERFEHGLVALGLETLEGAHPIKPLMVRDANETAALVAHLKAHGILATAISYPVVPKGADEIRFQISADHTEADIDEVLSVLAAYGD